MGFEVFMVFVMPVFMWVLIFGGVVACLAMWRILSGDLPWKMIDDEYRNEGHDWDSRNEDVETIEDVR